MNDTVETIELAIKQLTWCMDCGKHYILWLQPNSVPSAGSDILYNVCISCRKERIA